MRFSASLKNILTVNFILIGIVPLLIVGFTALHFMSTQMRKEISDKNSLLAKSLADEIEMFLSEPTNLLKQAETVIHSKGLIPIDRINNYLNSLITGYRYFNRLDLLDDAGVVRHLAPFHEDSLGVDAPGKAFFQAARRTNLPSWSPTFISAGTGRPTSMISHPMDQGMLVGYLDLSHLGAMIKKIKLGKQGYAAIADQNGITIAHPNRRLVAEQFSVRNLEVFQKAASGFEGTFKYRFRGLEKLGSVSLVPSSKWAVVVTQPVQEAFAPVTRTRNLIIAGTLFTGMLALTLALFSSRIISRPLAQLSENSRRIAQGQDTAIGRISSYSEVDNLAENFSFMLETLNGKEEDLRESRERFQAFFEGTTSCILFIRDRTIKYVNQATLDTFGFTEDEMIGQSTALIHPSPQSFEEIGKAVYPALQEKGTCTWHGEWQYIKKNGETVWTDNHISALSDGSIVTIIHDISARKEAEEALRLSHERFLTVLDSIDATIYVSDMETHEILFMNKQMIESFGRDMTGEICWEVLRGESGPCSHCSNSQLIDEAGHPTGVHIWQGENPVTGRWYMNYDRAIKWIDGRLVRIQIATDISEIKRMEEQLRQSQKMESIGTLAGGIAHDFNNILGIIIGNVELAMDDIPEWSPVRINLDEVKTASLRAKDIVRQLLSFSRRTEQKRRPVRLDSLVLETMKLLRASLPTSIDISSRIQSDMGTVMADPTQIHQVLLNLCTNAAHAMEENGGTLEIRLSEIELKPEDSTQYPGIDPGRYARLDVRDTGNGIDPDIKDRIFDPYFTTKEIGKGTGMGLAVVHSIVKNHGGGISIESDMERGTTFNVLFPTVSDEPEEELFSAPELPHGNETILFIDDEQSLVKMGSQILGGLGYTVEVNTSPIDALKQFEANPDRFDVIITDMTMPRMAGDELARAVLRIRPDLPVILCTGYSHKINESKALTIGVKRFIEKPLDKRELAEAVRAALDDKVDKPFN